MRFITNLSDILKNAPKGLKLYSTLCGECTFKYADEHTITVKGDSTNHEYTFYPDGVYVSGGERLLFPSKKMHSWEMWEEELFKPGMFVKDAKESNRMCVYRGNNSFSYISGDRLGYDTYRSNYGFVFASPEEIKSFEAELALLNYKWNNDISDFERIGEAYTPKYKKGEIVYNPTATEDVMYKILAIEKSEDTKEMEYVVEILGVPVNPVRHYTCRMLDEWAEPQHKYDPGDYIKIVDTIKMIVSKDKKGYVVLDRDNKEGWYEREFIDDTSEKATVNETLNFIDQRREAFKKNIKLCKAEKAILWLTDIPIILDKVGQKSVCDFCKHATNCKFFNR